MIILHIDYHALKDSLQPMIVLYIDYPDFCRIESILRRTIVASAMDDSDSLVQTCIEMTSPQVSLLLAIQPECTWKVELGRVCIE